MKNTVITVIAAIMFVVLLAFLPRMCGQIKTYEPIPKECFEDEEMDFRQTHLVADGDTFDIYENQTRYIRIATTEAIPHGKLIRIGKEMDEKFQPRTIYFHVNGELERGEEYASYGRGYIIDYRVKDYDKAITHL